MAARRKYPWEEWFDQPRTVLLRGVHYRCSQSTMCQTIRNNASSRGVHIKLTDTDTEIIIEVKHDPRGEFPIGSGSDGTPPRVVSSAFP